MATQREGGSGVPWIGREQGRKLGTGELGLKSLAHSRYILCAPARSVTSSGSSGRSRFRDRFRDRVRKYPELLEVTGQFQNSSQKLVRIPGSSEVLPEAPKTTPTCTKVAESRLFDKWTCARDE